MYESNSANKETALVKYRMHEVSADRPRGRQTPRAGDTLFNHDASLPSNHTLTRMPLDKSTIVIYQENGHRRHREIAYRGSSCLKETGQIPRDFVPYQDFILYEDNGKLPSCGRSRRSAKPILHHWGNASSLLDRRHGASSKVMQPAPMVPLPPTPPFSPTDSESTGDSPRGDSLPTPDLSDLDEELYWGCCEEQKVKCKVLRRVEAKIKTENS